MGYLSSLHRYEIRNIQRRIRNTKKENKNAEKQIDLPPAQPPHSPYLSSLHRYEIRNIQRRIRNTKKETQKYERKTQKCKQQIDLFSRTANSPPLSLFTPQIRNTK